MGHKVNPIGLRIPYIKTWSSRWFARDRDFATYLHEDLKIRQYIKEHLGAAGIARAEIERTSERLRLILHTSRPGVIIGRKGVDIDRLRDELSQMTKKEIHIDIKEVKNPAIEPQLIADNIAFQLIKRIAFRRAMKKAVQLAMSSGALGIKVKCAGRLGGSEMKRRETYHQGKVPLHTLRANVDYGFTEALTTYGLIGTKVWIYRGDLLMKGAKGQPKEQSKEPPREQGPHATVVSEKGQIS